MYVIFRRAADEMKQSPVSVVLKYLQVHFNNVYAVLIYLQVHSINLYVVLSFNTGP